MLNAYTVSHIHSSRTEKGDWMKCAWKGFNNIVERTSSHGFFKVFILLIVVCILILCVNWLDILHVKSVFA